MTLHVFSDSFGLYPNYAVENVRKYCDLNRARFVNLVDHSKIITPEIECISTSIKKQKKIIDAMHEPLDRVVFHAYQSSSYYLLQFVKSKFPKASICWVFWSFELYNRDSVIDDLFEPFSKKYVRSHTTFINTLKRKAFRTLPEALINTIYRLFDKAQVTEKTYTHSFVDIDEFYSLLHHDYLYLRNHFDTPQIVNKKIAYLSLEKMIPDLSETATTGNQIMVGHSSTPDGNQYEILSRLSNYELSSKLFLPLAYGDEDYKKEISTYARSLFPDVEVLSQKLEPKLYYQKLKDIGYCILNLKVQQGIGNITALLWYGVKVFLSIHSSTYLDFKEWGLIVFSIEEDLSEASLKKKLTLQEVLHNRNLLTHHLSESQLATYWHNFN